MMRPPCLSAPSVLPRVPQPRPGMSPCLPWSSRTCSPPTLAWGPVMGITGSVLIVPRQALGAWVPGASPWPHSGTLSHVDSGTEATHTCHNPERFCHPEGFLASRPRGHPAAMQHRCPAHRR